MTSFPGSFGLDPAFADISSSPTFSEPLGHRLTPTMDNNDLSEEYNLGNLAPWEIGPVEMNPGSPMHRLAGTTIIPPHQLKAPQGAYVAHYPGPPIQTSKSCQGPDGCNLFIFHIPNDLSNLDLYNLFLPFGNVISARIMVENETGRSRGFGFVSFDNRISADNAIKAMNGYQIGRKRLKVQHKKERHDMQAHMRMAPHPAFMQQQYPAMPGMIPGYYVPRGHPQQQQPPPHMQQPQQRSRRNGGHTGKNFIPGRGGRGRDVDPSMMLESALSSLTLDDFGSISQNGSDGSHEDDLPPSAPFHQASPTSILPNATTTTYDPWTSTSTTTFVPASNGVTYDPRPNESDILFDSDAHSNNVSEFQIRELQKRIKEQTAMLAGQNELLQHLLSQQRTEDSPSSSQQPSPIPTSGGLQ